VEAAATQLRSLITNQASSRGPLTLSSIAAPLKTHAPIFQVNFQPNRSYDPKRERAQAQALKREAVREKKSASKEVKRASHAEARLQNERGAKMGAQQKAKRLNAFSDLQDIARDTNLMNRASKKNKKGGKAF